MRIAFSFLITLSLLLAGAGCRQRDVRTMTIDVPGMATPQDEEKIVRALGTLAADKFKLLEVDPKTRQLKVKYDSMMIAKKNIELTIVDIGYEANGIKPVK